MSQHSYAQVDIHEMEKEIVLKADTPGMTGQDVKVCPFAARLLPVVAPTIEAQQTFDLRDLHLATGKVVLGQFNLQIHLPVGPPLPLPHDCLTFCAQVTYEPETRTLAISGERSAEHSEKDEAGRFARYERRFGSFQRRFKLPNNVDTSAITAKVSSGASADAEAHRSICHLPNG